MGFGNIQGRAYTNPSAPRAKAVCDDCGEWYLRSELQKDYEYFGPSLQWTGYLKCWRCIDKPQPQLKPIILPPDPVPVYLPRPEIFSLDSGTQGFTLYTLGIAGGPSEGGGYPIFPTYPDDKTGALASIADITGTTIPAGLTDRSINLNPANATLALMIANPNRSWLAIYNPVQSQAWISLGTATLGAAANIMIGPGEVAYWPPTTTAPVPLTADDGTPLTTDDGQILMSDPGMSVYGGALTALGLMPGAPLWAWEAPGDSVVLTSDDGTTLTSDDGQVLVSDAT